MNSLPHNCSLLLSKAWPWQTQPCQGWDRGLAQGKEEMPAWLWSPAQPRPGNFRMVWAGRTSGISSFTPSPGQGTQGPLQPGLEPSRDGAKLHQLCRSLKIPDPAQEKVMEHSQGSALHPKAAGHSFCSGLDCSSPGQGFGKHNCSRQQRSLRMKHGCLSITELLRS